MNKGMFLSHLGRNHDALEAVQKATQKKPQDVKMWHAKCYVLRGLGRWDDALKALDKASEVKPDDASTLLLKSIVYASKGNKKIALEYLKKAIEIDPKLKEKAKTNSAFKFLRSDPDFIKIIE